VLTPTAHILLIDFGSAAPLLPARDDGSQQIPRRYCRVPCGTCDYISPEILQAHEEALVALEMTDDDQDTRGSASGAGGGGAEDVTGGYGRETDWWSFGAMLYEMAYGVAPFFANDIRQTYLKIMNHDVRDPAIRGCLADFLDSEKLAISKVGPNLRRIREFSPPVWKSIPCVNVDIPNAVPSRCRLLTNNEERLGRRSNQELTHHIFFEDTDWRDLYARE
jgi:serine/threonine protein kinase